MPMAALRVVILLSVYVLFDSLQLIVHMGSLISVFRTLKPDLSTYVEQYFLTLNICGTAHLFYLIGCSMALAKTILQSTNPGAYVLLVGAGCVTWGVLNRCRMRGDYAVSALAVAFLSLLVVIYTQVQSIYASTVLVSTYTFVYIISAALCTAAYRLSPFHPLANFPGPWLWYISSLKLSWVSLQGRRHLIIDELHRQYGPFVRIGPDTLSVNTLSANYIYGAQAHMEKSDSYLLPGRQPNVSLFFKQKTEKTHSDRKRVWSAAFTGSAVVHFFPALERRTWQLLSCIEERQAAGKDGYVDLAKCFCHWSYDFMGDMVFGGCNNLELMKTGDPNKLVEGGKVATIVVDRPVTRLRDIAASLMRTRIKSDADVELRDLTSYLLAGDLQTGERISHADLELEAIVAIQGGERTLTKMREISIHKL
ncbi:hypothetical protein IEO21_06318 [Rhodonia placenta]|uniref:Cytochrome P450 n=1 Tax=Rhodonia placenta TaxID=104341 RepID=A0A8H7P0B1_9APHY|nr:hypothetical protein IEO21_06318 [Postia placenta]